MSAWAEEIDANWGRRGWIDSRRGITGHLDVLAARIGRAALALGVDPRIDPIAELTIRSASGPWTPSTVSWGGAARLLRALDGWIVLSLARPTDIDSVPALLGTWDVPAEPWAAVAADALARPAEELIADARRLGMAAAVVPEAPPDDRPGVVTSVFGTSGGRALDGLRVLDLSSMWAGPLCGAMLAEAGAQVTKVESTGRPDGARRGLPHLYERLNAQKREHVIDLGSASGRGALRDLLAGADVAIVSGRARAVEQLGIDWLDLLESTRLHVVVSITGYGLGEPGRDWIAFGDDAAAAGGLVEWNDGAPAFVGDAVADPLTGLTAAAAALQAIGGDDDLLLDVSMRDVAAELARARVDG